MAGAEGIISELQLELESLGYSPGGESGVFTPTTQEALKQFQNASGVPLSERGALGPLTAAALESKLGGPSRAVEALQSALTEVGLFQGTIDGRYGPDTLTAVRTLQSKTQLKVDGLFGPASATALIGLYSREEPEPAVPHPTTDPPTTGTSPASTTVTSAPTESLREGTQGPAVTQLQKRLDALGYRPGPADGVFGSATASAVLAFEKRQGLARDGVATRIVLAALDHPGGAGPRSLLPAPHVEVDLARQIAFVVLPGKSVMTLNVSTGNGETYHQPGGGTALAYTPIGSFRIDRKITGDHQAPLGTLYNPMYFYKGWAIHGSANVPAYPASHGCVRISYSDAEWLFPLLPIGTVVVIYDSAAKVSAITPIPANAVPGF